MRFLVICLLVGAGYWYYSGMYQQSAHPDYQQKLIKNAENMRECMKRKEYAARRTLTNAGDLEEICAEQHNLYRENGQWHSYDDVRPD